MKFKIYGFLSCSAYFSDMKLTSVEFNIELVQTSRGLCISIEIERDETFLAREDKLILRDIRAIVNQVIPFVNEILLKIKYSDAHPLIDTISLLDFYYLFVEDQSIKTGKEFDRPFAIEGFPPLAGVDYNDEIFIRDYIDAMTSYFKYNLDDCIRRGITSLENYFEYLGIEGKKEGLVFKSGSRPTFMSKLEEHLRVKENFVMPPQVINIAFKTIWLIYKIRNAIVHDKYRLQTNERWMCNRLIYALYNIYNPRIGAKGLGSMYIVRLGIQFQTIDSLISWNEFNHNYTLEFSEEQTRYLCNKFGLKIPQVIQSGSFPHNV
ncbi:hypothetical protein [Calidifontibacillus oryziterrae]|uniref:hypothetical protein n=1 Tax=Calidifontibacillus oryziterrae TaxID=1191699 RepID=UPI00031A2999|nr:hypothetical protein [Calidifontibacillus oryziterrae]